MSDHLGLGLRRALAFAVDWLVVVLWGGALFAIVMVTTGGDPPRPDGPWIAQAIGFLTMTLPVTLYFTACEASPLRGSLGKRALGLVVSRESGGPVSFGSALLRNATKFVPWEFGHLVAQQAAFSGDAGFPVWVWGPAVVAFGGPVWWIIAAMTNGRTPYDRWASARVRPSS